MTNANTYPYRDRQMSFRHLSRSVTLNSGTKRDKSVTCHDLSRSYQRLRFSGTTEEDLPS